MKRWQVGMLAATLCVGGLVLAQQANAAVVASDDFTYADGALAGASGGSGWAGAWAKRPGTNTDAVATGVGSVTGDNSAVFDNQGASYRTISGGAISTGDIWISVDMARTDANGTASSFVGFGLLAGAPPATGDPLLGTSLYVGETWAGATWDLQRGAVATGTGATTTMTNLVVHIDFTGGAIDLLVAPNKLAAPGAADASIAAVADAFDTILFRSGGAGATTRTLSFDNLVIGTTAADVGFVPEPASLALFGLGGLLMLRRRCIA